MLSIFALSWALTFGYVPQQLESVSSKTVELDSSKIATVATASIGIMAFDRIYIHTDVETYQYISAKGYTFNPYRADYTFGADFYITKNIMLGIEHECDHPVVSKTNMAIDYKYVGAETKIFVRIGSKLK